MPLGAPGIGAGGRQGRPAATCTEAAGSRPPQQRRPINTTLHSTLCTATVALPSCFLACSPSPAVQPPPERTRTPGACLACGQHLPSPRRHCVILTTQAQAPLCKAVSSSSPVLLLPALPCCHTAGRRRGRCAATVLASAAHEGPSSGARTLCFSHEAEQRLTAPVERAPSGFGATRQCPKVGSPQQPARLLACSCNWALRSRPPPAARERPYSAVTAAHRRRPHPLPIPPCRHPPAMPLFLAPAVAAAVAAAAFILLWARRRW